MRSRWWWLAALLVLGGCEEEVEEVEDPEPVAPVEVTAEDTPTPTAPAGDVAALQARVAALEAELASCRAGPPAGGTQVAPVPADVPGETAPTTTGGETASNGTSGSTSSSRRRDAPSARGGLLDQILGGPTGTTGRRGAADEGEGEEEEEGDDEGGSTGRPLNPVDVLLGP